MVDEDAQRSAQEYRDTATKLRLLARQVRSYEARQDLLELAERFDRLASNRESSRDPET